MKKKILIADEDEQFTSELMTALQACDMFEVVGLATDGEQAIQMVKHKRPDILVLDLLLTKYDGLTVLEQIRSNWHRPKTMVASAFISNYVAASAVRMGAQQLIHKPCGVDVVIKSLQRLAAGEKDSPVIFLWNGERSVEALVTSILHDIGVPANMKGYLYLREAIILAAKDEDEHNAILKNRYSEVADTFQATAKSVDSAIRHAIEVAWDRGDLKTLQRYFGYTISNKKGKPTNTEFIAIIADNIRLRVKNDADSLE